MIGCSYKLFGMDNSHASWLYQLMHNFIRYFEKKAGLFRRKKHKPLFIEIHRTTRGILVLCLYFRVSGTLGFSGAARFSLFRRAHVKAKGTLDSVEQKNYAVGEQKVGQPRRPTSCVLYVAFFPSWRPRTELEWSNELDSFCGGQQVAFVLRGGRLE